MPEFRRYAATVAVFATILYGALLIAVFGVIALFANLEVIPSLFGPLAGPVAAGASVVFVLAMLLELGLRIPDRQQSVRVLRALVIGFGAYVAYALVGGLASLIGSRDPILGLLFAADAVSSPFAISAGIIALVIALLYMLVLASHLRDRGRPRWPWEEDDDDR